jgi:hypothetical protein
MIAATPAMEPSAAIDRIFDSLLAEPALAEPEWDYLAVIAEITPGSAELAVFRYAGDQPARMTPITDLSLLDRFIELREATTAPDGGQWQVCVLRLERDTAKAKLTYVYPADAPEWSVTPETFAQVAEAARPRPAHFS